MLDITYIREHSDIVRENLSRRQVPEYLTLLDTVLDLDTKWRSLKGKVDAARSRRNKVSQEINSAKKAGSDASKLITEAAEIPKIIAAAETELFEMEAKTRAALLRIPNIMHESVPYGKDDSENKTVKLVGKKPLLAFTPKSHVDIISEYDLADLDRATKVSGARWYFLKNELVVLEMALVRYATDLLMKKGFTPVVPPFMISRESIEGVTSLADFEEALYKIEGENLYPISTSEHPLTALYSGENLESSKLPIKLAGISSCFRKEAGAHGKDQKGIFRVHQFTKVEQLVFCKPEESWQIHEALLKNAMDFFESLGFHFRVVNICTGDLGIVAAKKYDIEVWYPVQNAYREVVSCSNCTTYQSVRSNIKYSSGAERDYVHTLNSTCVPTTRAMVAIIENFQDEKGNIHIPEVLHKYTGFKVIKKK